MKLETLSTEELAMLIAMITSRMSQDPHTQVGSCIISENNEFLSIGYNKVPKAWQGDFPWARNSDEVGVENTKYPYVIHSEANALNNYKGPKEKLENATIYVTLFPCPNCAKQIVESGIKRVVYKDDFYKDTLDNQCSKRLLMQCGVEFVQFNELFNLPEEMKLRLHI
ncbi:MAG: cytidine deaminase [Bacilli bacterium]|nr:cytidine deaminase [Bacilli bacterium]